MIVISIYQTSNVESFAEKKAADQGSRIVLENNYVDGSSTNKPTSENRPPKYPVTKVKVKRHLKETELPQKTPSIFDLDSEEKIFAKSLKTKRSNTDYFPATVKVKAKVPVNVSTTGAAKEDYPAGKRESPKAGRMSPLRSTVVDRYSSTLTTKTFADYCRGRL